MTTKIDLADIAISQGDILAIHQALSTADLGDPGHPSAWGNFLAQTTSQGHFELEILEALIANACHDQVPTEAACVLLLESLRLAPVAHHSIPPGPWLAQAQTLALAFLQSARHNADSRPVLWEMVFSGLSHQIRPLYAAPDLDRLVAILHTYPFVLEDAYLVPSLLSPLMDAWADRPDLLDELMARYGQFPATAKKLNRLTGK